MSALISSISAEPSVALSSPAAVIATERAHLAQMLRSYQNSINQGQSAAQLKALAKQIADAAKLLNTTVTLPTAAAGGPGSADTDGDADGSSATLGATAGATPATAGTVDLKT